MAGRAARDGAADPPRLPGAAAGGRARRVPGDAAAPRDQGRGRGDRAAAPGRVRLRRRGAPLLGVRGHRAGPRGPRRRPPGAPAGAPRGRRPGLDRRLRRTARRRPPAPGRGTRGVAPDGGQLVRDGAGTAPERTGRGGAGGHALVSRSGDPVAGPFRVPFAGMLAR
ncbi:hypothetical protein SGPA1_21959 [Streptomyces misionensis JCM 4497]